MKRIFYLTLGLLIAGLVLLPTDGRTDDSQNAGNKTVSQDSIKKDSAKKDAVKKEMHKKKIKKTDKKSSEFKGHAMYVASKNSPKKLYHLATSGFAKRIKPGNLIEFSSRQEAEKAGYQPDKEVVKQK